MRKIKWFLVLALVVLLFYSRFVNLSWGLPYPFHPDERNMGWAIMRLSSGTLFKPDFFAYGQLPLYLGFFLVKIYHLLINKISSSVTFDEATMALRLISAVASVLNVLVLVKIVQIFSKKLLTTHYLLLTLPIIIFSPALIQFAHFGTTESLLILFYSLIIYLSLKIIRAASEVNLNSIILHTAIITGLALATKISAVIFLAVPFFALYLASDVNGIGSKFFKFVKYITTSLVLGIVFSPYNIISLNEFLGSMKYESDIASGQYLAFYTRQFFETVPFIFQFVKIFPYALGVPATLLFVISFLLLPRNKEINLLRFSFLIYFLFNAFLYAKWTRFMAPIMPLMLVFVIVFMFYRFKNKKHPFPSANGFPSCKRGAGVFFYTIIIILTIIPGIAYLAIYQNPDVRFSASEWIYKNIPANSLILSETANVVDIPIPAPNNKNLVNNYRIISFNFYDLDQDIDLQRMLNMYLSQADYIFIPSRRIFMNHTCLTNFQFSIFNFQSIPKIFNSEKCRQLKEKYPILNNYYQKLFSGELGFKKVAEFSSYPKINLFGRILIEFSDEQAEETWTVFDHPVIRIYKRS